MDSWLYRLAWFAMLPFIYARLAWRGMAQRGYWQGWGERLGRYRQPPLAGSLWLHAVSVGEVRAAEPIARGLREAFPGRPLLVSCMTPTGRDMALSLFGSSATVVYLPYDFISAHARLIRRFDPALLVILETEIWPNLVAACRREGVPAALVNARLSARSQRGYARFSPVRRLIGTALALLDVVAAQFPADAGRLQSLAARDIAVTGNMKFDMPVPAALTAQGAAWRAALGGRKVFLAASTREGEEALLLDAWLRATPGIDALFVIVPRHPQRFDEVARLIAQRGLRVDRRSQAAPGAAAVWLGDSMGEMAAYFAMCDVAFVGGSLKPFGGQNLIEACAQGKPVLMGPSTFNFAAAAELAVEAGAMRACADADAVVAALRDWLDDDLARAAASAAALAFTREHAGATARTLALIAPLVEKKAKPQH